LLGLIVRRCERLRAASRPEPGSQTAPA